MQIEPDKPIRILLTLEDPPELIKLRKDYAALKEEHERFHLAIYNLTSTLLRLGRAKRIIRQLGGDPEAYGL